MNCRNCAAEVKLPLVDLGFSPPSNAYLQRSQLCEPEVYYPLRLWVCESCWLVQTEDYNKAEDLFSAEYAYFSSTSRSWLAHARNFAEAVTSRFDLSRNSFVVEIASNDGYLLRNFNDSGIPCLGIEPTLGTAQAAENLGIEVIKDFFTAKLAQNIVKDYGEADLIVGNNVYAHVPDIKDFTFGLKHMLKPSGVISLEFPHVLRMITDCQFDTVYHEHFSYLSLFTVSLIFSNAGLRVFDVEKIGTHGGSLRVFGCHYGDMRVTSPSVESVLAEESSFGLKSARAYVDFQKTAEVARFSILHFLVKEKSLGKRIYAYGAAAKGNTLLNFIGVKQGLIEGVFDAAPSKQGMFLPGSHIPILDSRLIPNVKPDVLLIFPWNIVSELQLELAYVAEWGCKLYRLTPSVLELG